MILNKHGGAIFIMLLAPIITFSLMIGMNHHLTNDNKKIPQEVTQISMVKHIKKEPEKKIKKVEPKKRATKSQSPAPFKGLNTALSGIDLGLFGFDDNISSLDDDLLGSNGNTIMTADLVDVPPRPISRGEFKYPPSAKRNGVKGYVVLSILIGKTGSVVQVQVLESSPQGVFDSAALRGMQSWKFEPAKYKNDIVEVWAKQRIRFDLS